ncbi:MAG TPA: hypothetical protein VHK67_03710 [Rhabdochlamydiaceae bacterium]|jgi:hypothetical protein|nr:hypothetical protein [Rhabdochlamydiaceae bacterium]
MVQPVHLSIHIAPMSIVAAIVITQIIFRDKFMDQTGYRFNAILDAFYDAGKSLALESPVTVLAAGITHFVQPLTTHAPFLALSPEDPLKATLFVASVFALKSALYPLLSQITTAEQTKTKQGVTQGTVVKHWIVLHFFPLVLGTGYAFYAKIPLRLVQSALYTAALVPLIKLVGIGLNCFCEMEEVKARIQGLHVWMTLGHAIN